MAPQRYPPANPQNLWLLGYMGKWQLRMKFRLLIPMTWNQGESCGLCRWAQCNPRGSSKWDKGTRGEPEPDSMRRMWLRDAGERAPSAKEFERLLETGKHQETDSPSGLQKESKPWPHLYSSRGKPFSTIELQKWEVIHLCCLSH